VAISARSADEGSEAAGRLTALGGGRALGLVADVRAAGDVRDLVETAARELGGLDVLVNNAGVGHFGPVESISDEQWRQVIDTNLTGAFLCSREAIPRLRERGGGWIINIGSLAGKNPFAGGSVYNASKFGLLGFSEAMMLDLRDQDIRVTCIMPGSVETYFNDNTPSEKGAWKIQPEDIARLVIDLLEMPGRSLPSRIEIRPSRPPKKG
jgi:3-oxoacyl-[acyl-carrier protein] reductase